MPQLTGGQALVAGMRQAGVTTLFGIPGVHNGGLYDALLDAPDIRVVITRHEQGAAFMADGYARASGRVACVATITGPGITNAATGWRRRTRSRRRCCTSRRRWVRPRGRRKPANCTSCGTSQACCGRWWRSTSLWSPWRRFRAP